MSYLITNGSDEIQASLKAASNESTYAAALIFTQIVVNLVYLFKYIVKLETKKFHIMMFSLLLGY